ncbi:hypothetical protein WJ65_32645, partial [Burkholderia ubonensis]
MGRHARGEVGAEGGGAATAGIEVVPIIPLRDIRNEPRIALRIVIGDDSRVAHRRMRTQRGLDLTWLDTKAANLDLLVGAAEIVDFTIGMA